MRISQEFSQLKPQTFPKPQSLPANSASGIRRMTMPTGIDNAPSTMEIPHCAPVCRVMANAFPPTKAISTCAPIMMALMAMKNQLRHMPLKMLNLLLSWRLLLGC